MTGPLESRGDGPPGNFAEVFMVEMGTAIERLGLDPRSLLPYGEGAVKVPLAQVAQREKGGRHGKVVLVTGITPTPHGEGKTVTAIGLAMALCRRGRNAVPCLRQPSLGPVFGVKGGASGGGESTVEPSARINLGLTGDIAAVEAAHNLLAAMVDNHIYHGNALGIDPSRVVWPRTVDMNDRALRRIRIESLTPKKDEGRAGTFVIAAASEIMAIHALAQDYADLKKRLGEVVVAFTSQGRAVRARDLKAEGAMAVLLKDALAPNLVLTKEGTPAFVHGGPFGNIAHGTASLVSIRLALASADLAIVEAGFGSDLGAEKFVDIVAPTGGFEVSTAVLVATIRALRYHGGASLDQAGKPNLELLRAGLPNLEKHIENLRAYGIEPVVALNLFPSDSTDERAAVRSYCAEQRARFAESTPFQDGSGGALELAEQVEISLSPGSVSHPVYAWTDSLRSKVERVVRVVYGGAGVRWDPSAESGLAEAEELGAGSLPICVSKTQSSLSDDAKLVGRPRDFTVRVGRVEVHAGAGFTVVHMGNVMTMPGLPLHPAAESIDLTAEGEIVGVR